VGTWKTDAPGRNGPIGTWLFTFNADGSSVQDIKTPSRAIRVQQTYTAQHGEIDMKFGSAVVNGSSPTSNWPQTQIFIYEIDGNKLKLGFPGKKSRLVFIRQ